jgi:inner membrane protein
VYRRGHWGVSLLVFAPVGFALLAVGRPTLAVAGGGAVLWLSTLPDVDHRLPLVSHRGVTHTVAFALAVGLVGAGVGVALAPVVGGGRVALGLFGFGVGVLGILAHLLADALTPAGVPLFWPLSGRRRSLSLTRADDTAANLLLLALGVGATAATAVLALRVT